MTLDLPGLKPYRTLRRPLEHQRNGMFVAEGEKVVRRLVESNLEILSVLLTPEWLQTYRPELDQRPGRIEVFLGKKELLQSIVGFHLHQGIMAVARIPKSEDLEGMMRNTRRPCLVVAVDGLTNSENLGVIVRNCVAFGVQALLVGETSSSPYLRRAVRNSMGTIFKLPVCDCDRLGETLLSLRSRYNVRTFAAHPAADENTLTRANFSGNCCIVFGSEGEGISKDVLAACDELIAIPMQLGVDSLNVASASSVLLYEVQRRRALS